MLGATVIGESFHITLAHSVEAIFPVSGHVICDESGGTMTMTLVHPLALGCLPNMRIETELAFPPLFATQRLRVSSPTPKLTHLLSRQRRRFELDHRMGELILILIQIARAMNNGPSGFSKAKAFRRDPRLRPSRLARSASAVRSALAVQGSLALADLSRTLKSQ
jgi:hypothetical protein